MALFFDKKPYDKTMYTKPYTINEIAEITGFHRNSVLNAIRLKQLKATLLGHTYVVWPSDLAQWIHSHPRPSRVAHVHPLEVLR